jgi:hypothetical protein
VEVSKLPKPGDVVRVRDEAPEGVRGRTYLVERVEKHECDPWESCAFRDTDKGKTIYIVVTTTGERLELGWVSFNSN